MEAVEQVLSAGTRIATPNGEIPAEGLREGDEVRSRSGTQPIAWIGRRTIDLTRHVNPKAARPIRIGKRAFAENIPARYILV